MIGANMVQFKVVKGSSNGTLVDAISSREIKSDEVLIDVTHSGVCYTDHVCCYRLFPLRIRLYKLTVVIALSTSRHGSGP